MKNICLFILLATVAQALAACATNPVNGHSVLTLMSKDEELDIGKQNVSDQIDQYGLYSEKLDLLNYYRSLGAKLAKVSERQDVPYDYLLLDGDVYNAWSVPGHIATYRGILPYLNSETDLAMLLGHETGHVAAYHTSRQASNQFLAGVLVAGTAAYVAAASGDSRAGSSVAAITGAVAVVGLAAFGRGHEDEADTLGARYVKELGYPPEEAAGLFAEMGIYENLSDDVHEMFFGFKPEKSLSYDILRSHPEPKSRYAHIAQLYGEPMLLAVERGRAFGNDTIGRDRYLDMIDGLAYGPKRDEGVASRRKFYSPADRFTLNLPDGMYFRYFYSAPKAEVQPGPAGQPTTDAQDEESSRGVWRGVMPDKHLTVLISTSRYHKKHDAEEVLRIENPAIADVKYVQLGDRAVASGVNWVRRTGNLFSRPKDVGYEKVFVIPATADHVDPDDAEAIRREGHNFFVLKFVVGDDPQRLAAREVYEADGGHLPPDGLGDIDRKTFDTSTVDALASGVVKSFKALNQKAARAIQPLRVKVVTVQKGEMVARLADKMSFGLLREEIFRALNGLPADAQLKPGERVKLVVDPNR